MKMRKHVAACCFAATLIAFGANVAAEDSIWKEVPDYFVFSSGVGAWQTELLVEDDGTFTGCYRDADMGETGEGYPNGTVYICNFSGKFSEPLRFDKCMYEMNLEELKTEGNVGDFYVEDNVRYVYSEPYGIAGGSQFTLYAPGQPYELVSEEFAWWVRGTGEIQSSEYLDCYAICNEETMDGFVGYELSESDDIEKEYIFEESDERYLTQQDIAGMSKDQIQQAINEIYARHGRVFRNAESAEYFAFKSWYHPVPDKTDEQIVAEFNSYEKANVDFLAQYL